MKIMIVTPYIYPSVGGAQNYALNIALGLKNGYNHEIVIVTSGEKEGVIQKTKIQGMTIYRLPYRFKISNTPISFKWQNQIKSITENEKPDIINAHSPVPFMADVAASVSKKNRTPYILTYHSGSMIKHKLLPDILIWVYESIFLPRLLNSATKIVTYNDFLSRKYSYSEKITYITPGVDTNVYKPHGGSYKEPSSSENILFVGRIDKTSEWKGINVLLRSMPKVILSRPSVLLRIVGSGDAVKDYKTLAVKLGIANYVKFVGTKLGKDLVNEYRRASVLVLPSTTESESFGMVLIEALACGTPVIASNIGGMPYVIDSTEGGLLVEANNENKLAEAICTIMNDRRLHDKLSKTGLKNVKEKFTWQKSVTKTQDIFSRLDKVNNE